MNENVSKVEELRNLKYKGAIKSYIKAFVSLGKTDSLSIEAVTENIYQATMEIVEARMRFNLAQSDLRGRIQELEKLFSKPDENGLRLITHKVGQYIVERQEELQAQLNKMEGKK